MNGIMNMFAMMKQFQRFKQDPMGALASKFNIPKDIDINNADAVAQHLLNTRQVSQEQLNQISRMANMFRS